MREKFFFKNKFFVANINLQNITIEKLIMEFFIFFFNEMRFFMYETCIYTL